jgi:predicted branched-subunit amino acid permease
MTAFFVGRRALGAPERAAFFDGVRTMLPATVATAAWGLVTGVAMVKTGLPLWAAVLMTLTVFAGSAQLAALPLIAADAPLWVIFLTAAIVNLRFVIFSAALYPYFRHLPLRKRLLLGYITTDSGFALSLPRWTAETIGTPHGTQSPRERVWFFLGLTFPNWASWQVASIIGIFLADQIPGSWGLGFAAIIALIALVVPMINDRPSVIGVAVAGAIALVAVGLPLKLGLVAAVIAGMAAAVAADIVLDRIGAKR